ncbi:hypothetical protein KDA_02550 [Dictyobacter alpinus]|uniref:Uncharacterized protein n=1 Tax=Dictyobacter alpinus TaxID=2014873 RepID=A0A402B084_9CHLR|nr:hypothetical protein KDA_02550 [Dictyobacter alpinus]
MLIDKPDSSIQDPQRRKHLRNRVVLLRLPGTAGKVNTTMSVSTICEDEAKLFVVGYILFKDRDGHMCVSGH